MANKNGTVAEAIELAGELELEMSEESREQAVLREKFYEKWNRTAMEHESSKFYHNVTRPIIEIFLNYSEQYQMKKRKTINHGLVVKPIRSDSFNSRCQIDLVDMQSLPVGEYKWILNVQDHLTKFSIIRAEYEAW